ncbi:MAG: DNA cytosine methyltransferase [Muribaculaceae bacterium]
MVNNFTINKILNSKTYKLQYFGPSALDENGNIMPFNEQMAFITHYIQNRVDIKKLSYSKKAISLLRDVYDINESHSDNCVTDFCYQYNIFNEIENPTFKAQLNPTFKFIDLFAGIGGFRIAFQNVGGKCVFSSEWDVQAQKTYFENFGEVPFGDITKESIKECIPSKFDVLCGGFPCQAFSIAGYRKGFEDTRGTLFFDIATIIERHRPKSFLLENVKNLKSHDKGKTFKIIISTLEDLGYKVFTKVMNSMEYADIPQNRERLFIVGFDPKQVKSYDSFVFPSEIPLKKNIHDCIDNSVTDEQYFYRETQRYYPILSECMKSHDTVYQWRRHYVRENQSNVCPTLTANMGTGGHNVPLILTINGIRKFTPKECLNFQGYPPEYKFAPIAQSKCYQQAGNSVTVPLIQRIAQNIIDIL